MKNVLVLFAFLMSCTLLKAQVHAQVLVPFHVQYVPVKPVGNHPPLGIILQSPPRNLQWFIRRTTR